VIALLTAAAPLGLAAVARAADEIVFGLVPFAGIGELVARFGPLCELVERRVNRPATLRSASDYRGFLRRLRRTEFDLALVPPHFVTSGEDAGYRPVWWMPCAGAVELVAQVGVDAPEALRGKTVAVPDPLALVTILGRAFLERHGLAGAVRLRCAGNHANVLELVRRRLAPAAFVPRSFRERVPVAAAIGCHVLASFPAELGLVLLVRTAHPGLLEAVDEAGREIAAEAAAMAGLFPGPDRRLVRVRAGAFRDFQPMLARALAEVPT